MLHALLLLKALSDSILSIDRGIYNGRIVKPRYTCLEVFGGYRDLLKRAISMIADLDIGISFLSGYTSI